MCPLWDILLKRQSCFSPFLAHSYFDSHMVWMFLYFPGLYHPQRLRTTSVTSRDGRGALPALTADLYYLLSPGSALGSFCLLPPTIYVEVYSWILKRRTHYAPGEWFTLNAVLTHSMGGIKSLLWWFQLHQHNFPPHGTGKSWLNIVSFINWCFVSQIS